jgi:hypothetical protein
MSEGTQQDAEAHGNSMEEAHQAAEARTVAEPLPQHADAEPLVQTSTSAPRRRLTTRQLARRRRHLLQLMLQQTTRQTE